MMDTAKFPAPNLESKRGSWRLVGVRLWNAIVGASVKYGGWILRLFS